jgi:hypothetical protein
MHLLPTQQPKKLKVKLYRQTLQPMQMFTPQQQVEQQPNMTKVANDTSRTPLQATEHLK